MKKKSLICLGALLCAALVLVWALYPVRTPYQYPETDLAELYHMNWKERQSVCDVPANLMKRMTTEALAQTVLRNPLMELMAMQISVSCHMPPDCRGPYEAVGASFQGLAMLEARKDGRAVLEKIYAETSEEEDTWTRQYIRYILAAWDQEPSPPALSNDRIPNR